MRHVVLLLSALLLTIPSALSQSRLTYKMPSAETSRMERAVKDYQKGRYRPSTEELRKLAALYPDNPDIYF